MESIRRFLNKHDYEFHEDRNGDIVVDCGGQDYNYWQLVKLIYEHIEEWTYEQMLEISIRIDIPYETITFMKRKEG